MLQMTRNQCARVMPLLLTLASAVEAGGTLTNPIDNSDLEEEASFYPGGTVDASHFGPGKTVTVERWVTQPKSTTSVKTWSIQIFDSGEWTAEDSTEIPEGTAGGL